MWGSNGVVLRRCFSAVQPGRCQRRWNSNAFASTEPIGPSEFLNALEAVYSRSQWKAEDGLGFAISGGVDSMALATLYTIARRMDETLPVPHGLIVDHKVRPGSTEEAEWVAEQLKLKLNMDSTILPLTWPQTPDSENKRGFETTARTLRYQALGRECRSKQLESILVAHHADDQAETLIMRIILERLQTGLRGIQPVTGIPECHGIYGVHRSGGAMSEYEAWKDRKHLPFQIERGGIQLLRPLLAFEKSRLIATCKDQGIDWAEDKTNQDQTLTLRNAVRHIMQNHHLPAALSQTSLTNLAQHMQNRLKSHQKIVEKILDETRMALEIQTGSMIVRFPSSDVFLDGRPIENESDKHTARNIAVLYLERVSEIIIQHKVQGTSGQLSRAVDVIWPTLRIDDNDHIPSTMQKSFTINKVWYQIWEKPSPFKKHPNHHKREWLLSRQPVDKQEVADTAINIPVSSSPSTPSESTTWHLFDNRYWIRVTNKSHNELVIRTVTQEDLSNLSQTRNVSWEVMSSRRYLKAVFNLVKPATLRYNIPAIFQKSALDPNIPERMIALPTFGVYLDLPRNSHVEPLCTFDIRYQKLNTGKRPPRELIQAMGQKSRMLTKKDIGIESGRVMRDWMNQNTPSMTREKEEKKLWRKDMRKDMRKEENDEEEG
ncbi:PP-loop family-domain-containing protein [Dendryphion nanum]|uniref:tRNA(Ile)-lysidine synthetase n=1 Tax=Dendryphion nanum TaxID=256645 RepID=A0A9P9D7Y4_9PLEO|nr:PP-loop family-domain-containing protein [Dendryphion nanum]